MACDFKSIISLLVIEEEDPKEKKKADGKQQQTVEKIQAIIAAERCRVNRWEMP